MAAAAGPKPAVGPRGARASPVAAAWEISVAAAGGCLQILSHMKALWLADLMNDKAIRFLNCLAGPCRTVPGAKCLHLSSCCQRRGTGNSIRSQPPCKGLWKGVEECFEMVTERDDLPCLGSKKMSHSRMLLMVFPLNLRMSTGSVSPWSPFCCAVRVQDRQKGSGVFSKYEGLTHPSQLYRPSEQSEWQRRRQQQREGCSCGGGSVGVDSGYSPARSCRPERRVADLPAAALGGRGRAFPNTRETGVCE